MLPRSFFVVDVKGCVQSNYIKSGFLNYLGPDANPVKSHCCTASIQLSHNAFHNQSLSISRHPSVQVKRLPRGSTGVPERSFTLQIPSHPQLSSSQGLHPHPDTSTRSSASLPGRTSTPPRKEEMPANVTACQKLPHRGRMAAAS